MQAARASVIVRWKTVPKRWRGTSGQLLPFRVFPACAPLSSMVGGGSARHASKRRRHSSTTDRSHITGVAGASPSHKQAAPSSFLMKSEPDDFSVDDLAREGQTCWDGVRNYAARNVMRSMEVGDQVLFYHSSCKVPGVVGIAEVVKESYPDHTAFDPGSKYYDSKSTPSEPRWSMVDIRLVRKLRRCISLAELKQHKGGELKDMALLARGRLSVQPVTPAEWDFILALEDTPPSA
mmetsp:Transcript_5308/g.13530  ORF Transcript_5308/g.13530 Transcript_5308/m.13530 type:complete len:236 (-) Transcript_5308:35-742(-)